MELALETRSPSEARADVLVLGQYGDGARPAPEIAALDRALGGRLSRVQKSEMEVIEGIHSSDWAKIKQVVLEVHDFDNRLERIKALLSEQGFEVTVEPFAYRDGSNISVLSARHRDAHRRPSGDEDHELATEARDAGFGAVVA